MRLSEVTEESPVRATEGQVNEAMPCRCERQQTSKRRGVSYEVPQGKVV